MNKFLSVAAVAAFAVFGATGAFAQTASESIAISAKVPGVCSITGAGGAAAVIPTTSSGTLVAGPVTVSGLGSVTCNEDVTVTLVSTNGGATFQGGGSGALNGFASHIDYTATATVGGIIQTLATNGTAGASTTSPTTTSSGILPGSGQGYSVTITPTTPSSTVLAAGNYADTLTMTFTPVP